MRLISSLVIAFSTYSRLPMPQVDWSEENKQYSMCFFPAIGVVVGLLMTLWLTISEALGLNGFLTGAVGAVIPLIVTGGIHMDGFMDTMDAMASWQPRERRLEILKDTHTGAFAVIGCAAYLLVMAGLLSEVKPSDGLPVAAAFVVSRAMSALTLTWLPKARKEGMLSGFAGCARKKAVTWAGCAWVGVGAAVWLLVCGFRGLLPMAGAAACAAYYTRFANKYFGGVTGDLAGWFVQITELTAILMIVIGGKIG